MARPGIVGSGPRIIVLILTLLALVLGGFLWFDFLGLIDAKDTLAPILSLVGVRTRTRIEEPEAPDLLDQERLDAQWEALGLREEELDNWNEELDLHEAELRQMMDTIREREQALEEQEKSFNDRLKQYENKNANLRTVSQYLVNMPPQNAVDRLAEMDDQEIIDILRTTDTIAAEAGENSVTSFWLQLMPPDRAATIQRKMLEKPPAQ